MALLSRLVKTVAEVEGVDEAYVAGVARYLREAGLLSQAGRGRGAAQMTPQDAVHLLIGLNASSMAKDAPEAVRSFKGLVVVENVVPLEDEDGHPYYEEDDVIFALGTGKPFDGALEALVRGYIPIQDGRSRLEKDWEDSVEVHVLFRRPIASATITIDDTSAPDDKPEVLAITRFESRRSSVLTGRGRDRHDTASITDRTLREVGRVLAT